mgnify:CR=1 FL=1
MHDGQAGHLPIATLLSEILVSPHRIVWHTLFEEGLIEVIALGAVQSVHIIFKD